MRQASTILTVATRKRGLHDVTGAVGTWLAGAGIETGLLTLFCRHTSASLLIQENAEPDVRADLEAWFDLAAPDGDRRYTHTTEGPDDMPSHIRAALTQTSLSIPVMGGRVALGTWQGIYLFEHRIAPHRREIAAHVMGE